MPRFFESMDDVHGAATLCTSLVLRSERQGVVSLASIATGIFRNATHRLLLDQRHKVARAQGTGDLERGGGREGPAVPCQQKRKNQRLPYKEE